MPTRYPTAGYWCGRALETMSREELMEVVNELADELKATRETYQNDIRELRELYKRVPKRRPGMFMP